MPSVDVPSSYQSIPAPTWMESDAWTERLGRYAQKGLSATEVQETRAYLQARGPHTPGPPDRPSREEYVPAGEEGQHLIRDGAGVPLLKFVDAGAVLAIWSPADGGGLINPKGTGLRRFGLIHTVARGLGRYRQEWDSAGLSKGAWVGTVRDRANPHDSHAVALHAPGSANRFGWVQRGRNAAVARMIDNDILVAAILLNTPEG